jgi:hypothetical protein
VREGRNSLIVIISFSREDIEERGESGARIGGGGRWGYGVERKGDKDFDLSNQENPTSPYEIR